MAGKKGVGGRPRKDVPERKRISVHAMVKKLAATGVSQPVIASILDMAPRTLEYKLAEDEKLRAAWEQGRNKWHALIHKGLHNKVKEENVQMLIFAAKTQLGMKEVSRVEVGGIEEALKALAAEDDDGDGE